MQVTQISHNTPNSYDYELFKMLENVKTDKIEVNDNLSTKKASVSWQKDILLDALDMLENSIQLDNSHPLSKKEYAPIESYEEALIELSFLKSPIFNQEASLAQANIKAEDVIFFGTDSAEVIKSIVDYKKQMQNQWDVYEEMKYGKMYDVFIQMDKMATMASVIFGIPLDVKLHGKDQHYFLRIARTLKKENNKWVIISGIVSIASTGQSTSDLILTKPDTTKTQETPATKK